MKLLLDDARLAVIDRCLRVYPVSGVTTNPSILKAAGLTAFTDDLVAIRRAVGRQRSLHVQVVATETTAMLREAYRIVELLDPDVNVKIPVTEAGLPAIRRLAAGGVHVTATAVYSTLQGLLAIESGAEFVAPYVNRMLDLGMHPMESIAALAADIEREHSPARIVAASFTNAQQVTAAVAAGAHAVTVAPELLAASLGRADVTRAVTTFAADWEHTFGHPTLP